MRAARASLAVLIALALGTLAWAMAVRVPYPYDLEWMEGGMLCHALQMDGGRPLYGPPSLRFVSFAYTPLYPIVVAGLGRVFGLGYAVARGVSVIAFIGALALAFAFVRRSGGRALVALAVPAIAAAAFAPTGAWYDLARIDSLFIALATASIVACGWSRAGVAGPALGGALMVAAFFAKQTAAPFLLAVAAVLLVARRRDFVAYVLGAAAVAVPALAWLHLSSQGWFWTYAFGLHQRHPFDAVRAFVWTPLRLLLLLGPGVVLVPWALARRRGPALTLTTAAAAAGVAASCLGAGTDWSFFNALIPGVFFGALAMGVSAASIEAGDSRRASTVAWLLAASVSSAPGGLVALAASVLPGSAKDDLALPLGYDLRPYLPSAADRRAGDQLIARLRAEPGEVFVPFHPFYAHLAGKPTTLAAMNLADLQAAGLGPPRDLVDFIRNRRFALVVLDLEDPRFEEAGDPAREQRLEAEVFAQFPRLAGHYAVTERFRGPRVFSGGRFQPALLARPRAD